MILIPWFPETLDQQHSMRAGTVLILTGILLTTSHDRILFNVTT